MRSNSDAVGLGAVPQPSSNPTDAILALKRGVMRVVTITDCFIARDARVGGHGASICGSRGARRACLFISVCLVARGQIAVVMQLIKADVVTGMRGDGGNAAAQRKRGAERR